MVKLRSRQRKKNLRRRNRARELLQKNTKNRIQQPCVVINIRERAAIRPFLDKFKEAKKRFNLAMDITREDATASYEQGQSIKIFHPDRRVANQIGKLLTIPGVDIKIRRNSVRPPEKPTRDIENDTGENWLDWLDENDEDEEPDEWGEWDDDDVF